MAAQYWIGTNGNVYATNGGAVVDWGPAIGSPQAGGIEAAKGSVMGTQIKDPLPGGNAPAPAPAPSNPNGGSGSSAPAYQDKSNDISLQNAGLGGADQQQVSGLAAIDKALGGLLGQYDTESTANEGNYHTQSDTNRNNLETNKQTALVNAAQGRRGLFGTLSSLGALSGSGIDLANEAVQKGANEDLTGAEGTFSGNQVGLDTALNTFHAQDKQRRDDANTAAENAKTKVRHDTAVTKQGIFGNLANDYSAEGNAGEAARYTQMAADLYPEVANNSIPSSNLAYTAAAFTPGTLANYINNGATSVTAAPTQSGGSGQPNLPSLVAQNSDQKKKQLTPALVPA
jgi:hypothetical protein